MAQYEQPAVQEIAAREADSSRRLSPLIILLVAAAFAANAWFFYHQGQRDGANPTAEATSDATPASSSEPALPPASAPAQSTADNTTAAPANSAQPAATNDAAKPAGDAIPAAAPTTKSNLKAKSANRLVAKAAKPAPSSTAKISDRQAILVVRPKPMYPAQALRAGEQGTVLILAQVDVTGHVSDARVARRSGSYVLDRAATNEVRHWTFEPALHNGRPVMASVEVPVSYRLEQ